MKLIEKKCTNCGAALEFGSDDHTCKCSYCGRTFEIERNLEKSSNKTDYYLREIKTGLTVIPIILGIFFTLTFVIIFIFAFSIVRGINKSNIGSNSEYNNFINDIIKDQKDDDSYISSIDELSNDDYSSIDNGATFEIPNKANEVNNQYHSYIKDGSNVREKVYVAYKEEANKIIAVYLVNYKDFFHQENNYNVYIPIIYENILNGNHINKYNNPVVKAPEFYFDNENSSYVYGYSNLMNLYNDIIKPLEDDGYKVSESN